MSETNSPVAIKHDAYDVIVIGAGAAGLTAACTAAALGSRVLVLEYTNRIGGTTAISGGMVWIPGNHKMKDAGLHDNLDAAREYLAQTVPGFLQEPRIDAFLRRGDEAIRFLEANTSVKLQPVRRYPDYYPDAAGSTAGGRVLEPVPFDGRELGTDFALLRDPLPEFLLFGGMMVSREDLPILRRVGHSLHAVWHTAKLMARYALQRLHAHRGTSLVLGNALAARLFKSSRDLNVEIALSTSVKSLIVDGQSVTGVNVTHGGKLTQLRARNGVILATGGISHHPDLRFHYVPQSAGNLSATARSGATIGGAHLARSVGGKMSPTSSSVEDALAFWVPVSTFRRTDGSPAMFPHTVTDRAKPGLIAVNKEGVRFVNEAVSYHEFVCAQLRDAEQCVPSWLVCDSRFLWKYGLGRVRPFALSISSELESGYLKRARTLEELAIVLGISVQSFTTTILKFNEHAVEGDDPEFGRGSNIYQRHLGDADQLPNPCVASIERPPFYAVEVRPADLGMAAGVMTDDHAQVVNEDNQPIEGLYACGNDMHSVMNGAYPGPGITLGPALVFGYLAALHACKVNSESRPY